MKTIGNKKLYTARDLEKILPLSYFSILKYLKKGRIIGNKIGNSWYVTKKNLDNFLEVIEK